MVAKDHSSPSDVDMSDEDNISITSTAPSEQESEYEVETILTEFEFDDGIKYLVKWANYPIERCTWEPAESFCADQTLIDWNEEKKAIEEGKRTEFDLAEFERYLAALDDARGDRKRRRVAKRKRLGLEEAQKSPYAGKTSTSDIVAALESPGYAAALPKGSSSNGVPQATTSARSNKLDRRPFPTKQPPPPVSFGTAPTSIRLRRMNSSETPKLFNLSTRWRYEKAKTNEPTPDVDKLELFRPSDWPTRSGLTIAKIGSHKVSSPSSTNESNTTRLGLHSVSSPKHGGSGLARLGSQNANSPRLIELGSSKLGSHDVNSSKQLDSTADIGLHDVGSPRPLHPASEMFKPQHVGSPRRTDEIISRLGLYEVGSPMDLDCDEDPQPQHGGSYASNSPQLRRSPRPDSDSPFNRESRVGIWRPDTGSSSSRSEPKDAAIRRLPSRTPGPRAVFTRHNYFWNPGEVMIEMFYGPDKKEIGPARLCGLSQISKGKLMTSKKTHRLEVWFQHVCNLEEYDMLCESASFNKKYSTGWIEGFDDTEPSIYKIGEQLHRNKLVAILYPEHRTQNTILAYPPGSDFAFLDGNTRIPAGVFLHVAVRSELPPFDMITTRREKQRTKVESHQPKTLVLFHQNAPNTDQPYRIDIEGNIYHPTILPSNSNVANPTRECPKLQLKTPKEDSNFEILREATQPALQELNHQQLDPSSALHDYNIPLPVTHAPPDELETAQAVNDSSVAEPQTHPPSCPESSPINRFDTDMAESNAKAENYQSQLTDGRIDLDLFFKEKFDITYEALAVVNGHAKDLVTDVFYLMFPLGSEIVQSECKLLEAFLKQHNAITYSSHNPNDWERFARTLKEGIILAHESFMDYHTLSHFKDLTSKRFSFWNVSLSRPLQFTSQPTHFQRLFPHGGVILITEDFILREPNTTLIILSWFKDWIKQKFPGNWKIMFRPDILNWLLQQSEAKDSSGHGMWLAMYALIIQINSVGSEGMAGEILNDTSDEHCESVVISPPSISFYGSRTEDDDPNIPKGLTQEYRNTDHLAEFFAGWALIHNHQYRRFVVATVMKPLPRWEAWQHIEVRYGAKDFLTRAFTIDYKLHWNKLRSTSDKLKVVSDSKSQDPQHQHQHKQHQQNPTYTPRTPGAHGPSADAIDVSRTTRFSTNPSKLRYPMPYS